MGKDVPIPPWEGFGKEVMPPRQIFFNFSLLKWRADSCETSDPSTRWGCTSDATWLMLLVLLAHFSFTCDPIAAILTFHSVA